MTRYLKTRLKHLISPKYRYLSRFRVTPGDVVIDLGANVGEVSEYFLGRGAKVYAYEPNSHAFEILKKRTGHRPGITLIPAAVSNFTGQSKLYLHQSHAEGEVNFSQGSTLRAEKSNVGEDYLSVDVIHINDLLKAHDHIRILKIDIEGGEYEIMDEILKNISKIDYVVLETHENKGEGFMQKHEAMLATIKAAGAEDKIFMDWF